MIRGALTILVTLALGLLVTPLGAEAQQPERAPRIGVLFARSLSSIAHRYDAFRQGLRELGYIEGKTIIIEYRSAEGKLDRVPELAAELVRLKVDVILAAGDASIRALQQATRTIPIVVGTAGDLVGPGYAASLARPGGNITGLSATSPELSAKRLEILREVLPTISRVAILWNPSNPVKVQDFNEAKAGARALKLRLQSLEVRSATDFAGAFQTATRSRPDALLVLQDLLTGEYGPRIIEFTAKSRLPTMWVSKEWVEAGGLMSYGPSEPDMWRRAATYVDKILKGAKPADLPIEQPTRFELVINLRTAKTLGLAIPQSLLLRADHIIQ